MSNEPPPEQKPDRTADELAASTLVAALGKGFNAKPHKSNWLTKHRDEIAALKTRHPDLYEQVKAAYDAAQVKSAAQEPQEAA